MSLVDKVRQFARPFVFSVALGMGVYGCGSDPIVAPPGQNVPSVMQQCTVNHDCPNPDICHNNSCISPDAVSLPEAAKYARSFFLSSSTS